MDSGLLRDLEDFLGSSSVLFQAEDVVLYEYDGSVEKGRPDIVVFPTTTHEVSQIVKLAAKHHAPVVGRGAGGGHIRFNMARGSMSSHISQFPVGTYKKAHCHGPSAHVIILSGEGYSLMWREGMEPTRYDWQIGTLIVPPNRWFHQHFNTGPTPARYLAFKHEVALIRNAQGVPTAWISQRVGGDQIDYADESPQIRDMFAQALARHGMAPRMDEVYRAEVADLPPKTVSSEAAE